MKQDKSILGTLLAAGIIMLMLAACAKPYHFYVKYDVPESSVDLKGQAVNLQILDGRDSKNFLSEKAGNEFDRWDNRFALYHTPKKPKGYIETYPLAGLIEATMKKRLETMGITVVEGKTDATPLFELTLNTFFLNLDDRTWVSDFSYEVKLTLDNQKIGREKVSGQAERTKIMGRGAGEILVGDIFTESINKLNIQKLFKNAGIE
ncbi:MAG: hypothetical protein JRI64_00620 [Deltaproteobacteria bacterium]|nr:hypothetical protein [Deltaproteobacteria bacterium]